MNATAVESLAPDLTRDHPRSPRVTLAGLVVAARTLDKCRAELAGTLGEYHYDCPLDNLLFEFTGITADAFRDQVATGANDEEMADWIRARTTQIASSAIIRWNNDLRDKRISEMPIELQEFLEGYIPENVPADRVVYHWFDVYDLEEGRL